MRNHKQSVKVQIITWILGFAMVLALLVASVSFVLSVRYLKQTQLQSAESGIRFLGNELESDIDNVLTFANWISLDSTLKNYLSTVSKSYEEDKHTGKVLSLQAWNHLVNEFNIIGVRTMVNRVVVSTSDGEWYLQVISGADAISVSDIPSAIMEQDFFEFMLNNDLPVSMDITVNPMLKAESQKIIPIIKPIYSSDTNKYIGWVYMDMPISIITDRLKHFSLEDDETLYVSFPNGSTYRFEEGSLFSDILPAKAVSYTLPESEITISYLTSDKVLRHRIISYFGLIIIIFAAIILAGIFLSFRLQHTISSPVNAIIRRLKKIGEGDFSADSSIEWNNEFGEIGRGINSLSKDVSALMEKRVLDEKTRQELEYQILQSQINPHFLYNTLNTIKWMATIQGSDGIAEMSTALSRLLKNIAKNNSVVITLKQEFALVDDYFTIMRYRYAGTIELEYITEDETLLDNNIDRFSLQPIIENSIFHGIEPKGNAGKITIHTYRSDGNLLIDVTDNGVGMDKATIQSVLSGKGISSNDFFKQIGIKNVNERIKHTFGESYGISIKSVPGDYTTTSFVLPLQENSNVQTINS